MEEITNDDFQDLLKTFKRSSIHLETRDAYGTEVELPHMASAATESADDLEWLQDLVHHSAAASGKRAEQSNALASCRRASTGDDNSRPGPVTPVIRGTGQVWESGSTDRRPQVAASHSK